MPATGWAALKSTASHDSSLFGGDRPATPDRNEGGWSRSSSREEAGGRFEGGYVVTGAPPPVGQGAPMSPNEFLIVAVVAARKSPDAAGKEVIWYDISVRTTNHQWTVSKRFSDFIQAHEMICKLRLHHHANEVTDTRGSSSSRTAGNESARKGNESARSRSNNDYVPDATPYAHTDFPPPFPSKYHIRSNTSAGLVEARRVQLDTYWKGVLKYLQALTLAAIGFKKPYSAALRAAFAIMVDFLRASSQTELTENGMWSKDDPYFQSPNSSISSSRPKQQGKGPAGSPLADTKGIFGGMELEQQPPCKIILEPNTRFTLVFFLPGVLLGDIYVDAKGDRDRSVIIGGKWNGGITGLERLKEQGIFQHASHLSHQTAASTATTGGGSTDRSGNGDRRVSARRREERTVLMDTLPRGEFELIFDIPPPFERAHWYSEYEGGVLLIMWDAPPS